MTTHIGIIKGRDQAGLWVEFPESKCTSCQVNCSQATAQVVRLPDRADVRFTATRVEVSFDGAGHVWMLFSSLMLPLIGFLLGAILANQLLLTDFFSVLLSTIGLGLGVLVSKVGYKVFCNKSLAQSLVIKEVTRC